MGEQDKKKNVDEGNGENDERKNKRKASLMFPAKIFRLLPHYASPCPTHTHNLT